MASILVPLPALDFDPSEVAVGRSLPSGRRTTALTRGQERTADRPARAGRLRNPDDYRTCTGAAGEPVGHMPVEREVTRTLARETDFVHVPAGHPHRRRKTPGLARDPADDETPAWVVVDGNDVSARRPAMRMRSRGRLPGLRVWSCLDPVSDVWRTFNPCFNRCKP